MTLDIKYFIPEWDDQVVSHYDFWNDKPTEKSKKLYSHEIYDRPNYDGILISKVKIDESRSKREMIDKLGIHTYLRFHGPVFGDCGAWGYAKEKYPPYGTKEIIEYYDRVGVNYGVSIDHLCISKDHDINEKRKEITLQNAEEFLNLYQKKDPQNFHAVGAVQGWDKESYRDSMQSVIAMGYTKIALGGLARRPTSFIIDILKNIQDLIKDKDLWIHLFGVSRLNAITEFHRLGIRSFDSASALRQAWLGKEKNYLDNNYKGYTAIRIPFTTRGSNRKFKHFINSGLYSMEDMEFQETILYSMLRKYEFGNNEVTVEEIVDAFRDFNLQFDSSAPDYGEDYTRTLRDRPWLNCDCIICKETGMDVIIFRGNNRNRRRGFHNTYVFYKLLKQIREDPNYEIDMSDEIKKEKPEPKNTTKNSKVKLNPSLDDFF